MENLNNILFYTLERSIKTYRQFAQQELVKHGFNITIDQWLVLKALNDDPKQTQQQIAATVFKDYASVTRIIDLLVKKDYLTRTLHADDRRRFNLVLTENAIKILALMQPVINKNRETALAGINEQHATELRRILKTIIKNCQP
ncbi:MarR family winged helix-turn-helix transcriptional regulator [Mucilaginibacter sp. SP1R1]|uniref:MarR family winged helix-turn-helix transcriptional regulator n=1 Tax=Mucilaginibacter sp. SP1R1 TaxID=2723091 RepID=UPI001610D093|nr:MarR family transcriptional regulator [Mucilaginibacter sp. SP1R1]MBB6148207.1 DNA-binding MarR family transcriptional regulator [Mucilaginibacter sp. SP1R1]